MHLLPYLVVLEHWKKLLKLHAGMTVKPFRTDTLNTMIFELTFLMFTVKVKIRSPQQTSWNA